ncbi:hypothetical protein KC352_g12513, partial [Hortaea werneckii]
MSKEEDVQERHASVPNEDEIEPAEPDSIERVTVKPKGSVLSSPTGSTDGSTAGGDDHGRHGAVEMIGGPEPTDQPPLRTTAAEMEQKKGGRFAFLKRPQFYIVLCLSQALAITQTGTNTLTTLLGDEGTSIPAFQSLFNYILLAL